MAHVEAPAASVCCSEAPVLLLSQPFSLLWDIRRVDVRAPSTCRWTEETFQEVVGWFLTLMRQV